MTRPPMSTSTSQVDVDRWREVKETILRSEVRFEGETYRPVVEYQYVVDGIQFRGNTIVMGLVQFNWKGPAKRLVERYPAGSEVAVFADRLTPSKSVLQTGIDDHFPALLAVTVGLLFLGALMFFFGRA